MAEDKKKTDNSGGILGAINNLINKVKSATTASTSSSSSAGPYLPSSGNYSPSSVGTPKVQSGGSGSTGINTASHNLAGTNNIQNAGGIVRNTSKAGGDVYVLNYSKPSVTNPSIAKVNAQNYQSVYSSMADESSKKAGQAVNAISSVVDSFNQAAQQNQDYVNQLRQERLDKSREAAYAESEKKRNDLVQSITEEDYGKFFNADGSYVDFDSQIKNLNGQKKSLENIIGNAQNDGQKIAAQSELDTVLKQMEELDLLKNKRDALSETYTLETLKQGGDEQTYRSYREMLSHKDDNIIQRAGNAAQHLFTQTANEIPTAIDQFTYRAKANAANQGINDIKSEYEAGRIDTDTYVKALADVDDRIKQAQQDYNDSISQEIRKVVDQYGSNTYYGANDVEKFLLQAGESTAQFLLHYAIGKGVASLAYKEQAITAAGERFILENFGEEALRNATAEEIAKQGLNALGGSIATVSMSGTGMTEKINQLLDEGYSIDTAYSNGLLTGIVSYATEKIGMDAFVESLGTKVSSDIFGAVLKNRLVAGFLSEGGEELVEGLIDPFIDAVTLGKDYEVNGSELLMAFMLGGVSGAAMSGGAVALNMAQTSIELNQALKQNAQNRANTIALNNAAQNMGKLVINSRQQYNMAQAEMNLLSRNYSSMTDYQKGVYEEVKQIFDRAVSEYEEKSKVKGVTYETDNVSLPSAEENEATVVESLTPDFNHEVQEISQLDGLQNKVNNEVDQIINTENNVAARTQELLSNGGYNINAEVFNSLDSKAQNEALVAMDASKIFKLNVAVTNDEGIRQLALQQNPNITQEQLQKIIDGTSGLVTNDGRIIINGSKRPILYTLTHELTHGTESSKYYPQLKDIVKRAFGGDWDSAVESKAADYDNVQSFLNEDGTVNEEARRDNAEKEVVARFVEDKLGDEQFINDLVRYNYSLASKIFQNLNAFENHDEVVQIRNAFEKAFNDNYQQNGAMRTSTEIVDSDSGNNPHVQMSEKLYNLIKKVKDGTFAKTFGPHARIEMRSDTPKVLLDNVPNFANRPMVMDQKHVRSVTGEKTSGNYVHHLSEKQLASIPNEMENPIAIFKHKTQKSTNMVLNILDDEQKPVIVAIKPNSYQTYATERDGSYVIEIQDTNFIKTTFGLGDNGVDPEKYIVDNIELYYYPEGMTNEKLIQLVVGEHLRHAGPVPNSIVSESSSEVKTDSDKDLSADSEKVKSIEENGSKEAVKTTGNDALRFSYEKNGDIEIAQDALYETNKDKIIGTFEKNGQPISDADMRDMLGTAHDQMRVMADLMKKNSDLLPREVIGKTLLKDASYGYSVENSTKCPRTLAYDELCNYVSDKVGRPLTAIESFLVSQKLYSIAVEPQCLYCYVALDRKSYNEFVGRYIDQRDEAIRKYEEAGSPKLPKSFEKGKNNKLFTEFLDGRKATENMWNRYSAWIEAYNNGEKLLTKKDVRTDWSREEIKNSNGKEWEQLKDMLSYAQSASWAKKSYEYRAYFDDIRKLSQRQINSLNEHYGLRWYSFNDYTPAYILENMQQFTDASLKGLKGLAYTKDTDFARIFAPTGVNINISMYVTRNADGSFQIDPVQSGNLEEAIALREQYPNVGIVVTATNDDAIRWAMEQPWTDVVIPFHIVRTGSDIAEYYKWSVYNSEQNDTVIDDNIWKAYVESLTGVSSENEEAYKKASKKISKMIYPSEHQNDLDTYLRLCEERGLKPRFSSFLYMEDGVTPNPNYMKLVNETRQSDAETGYLVPQFDMEAALESFERFKNKGGFYGGWWKDGTQLDKEANEVANDVLAMEQGTKQYSDIRYGEGYVNFDEYRDMIRRRKNLERKHGTGRSFKLSYDNQTDQNLTNDQMEDNVLMVSDDQIPLTTKIPSSKDIQSQKVAQILDEVPKTEDVRDSKESKFKKFVHEWVDHLDGLVRLADRTGNREIENKADYAMLSSYRANLAITDKVYRYVTDGKNSRAEVIGESVNDILGDLDKKKMQILGEYVYHWRNVDSMSVEERLGEDYKNKPVFGPDVDADDSMERIAEIEAENPWVKDRAERIWAFEKIQRQMLVDAGVMSQEQANKLEEATPHYVPIRRAVAGKGTGSAMDPNSALLKFKGSSSDILPLDHNMIEHTRNVYRTASANSLHNEIMDTIGNLEGMESESLDELFENGFNPLSENPNEGMFMYAYKDGVKYGIPVSEEIYRSLSPMQNPNGWRDFKTIQNINEFRRNLITGWNPLFVLTNGLKDIQDAVYNTKHSLPTYARCYAEAWKQIATKGELYRLYMAAGGKNSGYINELGDAKLKSSNAFAKGMNRIEGLNEAVETAPRLAEFIATLEKGRSLEAAMANAADITVNFKRGGDTAKYINRNGCAFLNASIQGFNKQMRNIKTAKDGGAKAMLTYMAKAVLVSGVPLYVLNHLMWKDDKDYEELSDYVKANYYCIKKYGDGKFIRIPKGRIAAFYQTVLQNTADTLSGKTKMWDALLSDLDSFMDNIAPNNPWDNFILTPLIDAFGSPEGRTWYGEDLIPQRLQEVRDSEQFDETTDELSKAIGRLSRKVADATGANFLELSPYKINYVLDQYSGAIGDIGLPMMTQETSVAVDNPVAKGFATAFLDKFTTDSVLKNQNITDFYSLKKEATKLAKSMDATDEQVLASKYLDSVNSELSRLYHELHVTQGDSSLSNKEKYEKSRVIRKQMNDIAREALANYDNIDMTGNYASVGGVAYYKGEDGTWSKPSKSNLEKAAAAGLTDEDMDKYFATIGNISSIRSDIKSSTPEGQTADYTSATIDAIRNSGLSAKGMNTLYDSYYDSKFVAHVNAMGLTDEQSFELKVANKMAQGTKDENGKTVANSKAWAVAEAYESLGLLENVLKYIEDNDVAPSEMGLSKTVYNELRGKTAKKSKKSSGSGGSKKKKKVSPGSVIRNSGTSTVSSGRGISTSKRALIGSGSVGETVRPNSNFLRAYSGAMRGNNGANHRPARGASGGSMTCPKCGNRVSSGMSRCPICGTKLN